MKKPMSIGVGSTVRFLIPTDWSNTRFKVVEGRVQKIIDIGNDVQLYSIVHEKYSFGRLRDQIEILNGDLPATAMNDEWNKLFNLADKQGIRSWMGLETWLKKNCFPPELRKR